MPSNIIKLYHVKRSEDLINNQRIKIKTDLENQINNLSSYLGQNKAYVKFDCDLDYFKSEKYLACKWQTKMLI